MFNILDEYLKNRQDIDLTILEAVSARNNGKVFSFEEHLKGFIYAQLSALVSWKKIKDNQAKFDELFCNFDRSELKEQSPDFLIEEIKKQNKEMSPGPVMTSWGLSGAPNIREKTGRARKKRFIRLLR